MIPLTEDPQIHENFRRPSFLTTEGVSKPPAIPPLQCKRGTIEGPDTVMLETMIDELSNFGFDEFNNSEFISGMKSKLKDLLELAQAMPFNFDDEPDLSGQCKNRRLVRKQKTKKRHALEMMNELHKENEQGMDHNIPGVREQI